MSLVSKLFAGVGKAVLGCYSGDTVIAYPGGLRTAYVTIEGVLLDFSFEPGTNEVSGDGPVPRDELGDRERRTGKLSIPKTKVVELGITHTWSFNILGEMWFMQRRDGNDNDTDGAYSDFRITNVDPQTTRHAQPQANRPVQRA
jgi:hypothetical protein